MTAHRHGSAASIPNRQKSVEPHRNTPSASGHAVRLKTLVIGLGNPLVSDDSVGLRVVKHLQPGLARCDRMSKLAEDYWGGLRLMERMIGYDRAIVVDAICTGAAAGHDSPAGRTICADPEERVRPRCQPAHRPGVRPAGRCPLAARRSTFNLWVSRRRIY